MAAEMTPHYSVGKARDGDWRIYFRLDESTSFDQRVSYPTRRAATSVCSLLNKDEGLTAPTERTAR